MNIPDISLDDPAVYARLDPSGMGQRLMALPGQLRQAWEAGLALELPLDYRQVDKVVVVGMGGSGVGGDLLADLLALESGGPVFSVCRDYRLPPWVDARTLVIASSLSGNTEETLSCFQEAVGRSARVVALSSGGRLREMAQSHHIPFFQVTYSGEARTALGYSFLLPLALVQRLGLVADRARDIDGAVRLVERVGEESGPARSADRNPAKQLALALRGHLPVMYGAGFLAGVARRWKTQLNENAKTWAFAETLPELNHNAVDGYGLPGDLAPQVFVVLLRSPLLHPETLARYPVTAVLLERAGVAHKVVEAEGATPLSQMLSTVVLGDWASYYLGILNGVDPSPVAALEEVKRRLREGRR